MDQSLKKALKKAKRKQVLKIGIISFIVVLILLPILFKTGDYLAGKNANRLHDALFLQHAITEPNIQIDSQVKGQNAIFGGNIVTNRSKNINGYLVQWSTLTSSYDWLFSHIDHNELTPGFYWSDSQFYEYDKQTKNKTATFYHPSIQKYYYVQNEIEDIAQMDNHVAEVAISFDRPYTLQEIQAKIPDNLNIVWLYMASEIADESKGAPGIGVYGFDPFELPIDAYTSFISDLETYDERGYNETIQEFLTTNKDKSFHEVEILGIMLTGQTKNFEALGNQEFIRGSSVGAIAEMVPYIKPEK